MFDGSDVAPGEVEPGAVAECLDPGPVTVIGSCLAARWPPS